MSVGNKAPARADLAVSSATLALAHFGIEGNAGSDTNDIGIGSDHNLGSDIHVRLALHCDIAQRLASLADGWQAFCDCVLLDIVDRGDERSLPDLQPQIL